MHVARGLRHDVRTNLNSWHARCGVHNSTSPAMWVLAAPKGDHTNTSTSAPRGVSVCPLEPQRAPSVVEPLLRNKQPPDASARRLKQVTHCSYAPSTWPHLLGRLELSAPVQAANLPSHQETPPQRRSVVASTSGASSTPLAAAAAASEASRVYTMSRGDTATSGSPPSCINTQQR